MASCHPERSEGSLVRGTEMLPLRGVYPERSEGLRASAHALSMTRLALVVKTHHRGPTHHVYAPWHFLYFLPLPQGPGSLRPIFAGTAERADGAAVGVRPMPLALPLSGEVPPASDLA